MALTLIRPGSSFPRSTRRGTRRAGVVARSRSWRASRAPTPIPRIEAPRSPACAAPASWSCRRTHRLRALRRGSPPAEAASPSRTRLVRRQRLAVEDRLARDRYWLEERLHDEASALGVPHHPGHPVGRNAERGCFVMKALLEPVPEIGRAHV